MFDNQTPPNATPPSNLPMGEPDDMFAAAGGGADFAPAANVPLPVQAGPADLDTAQNIEPAPLPPTALDAGVLRPRSQPLPPSIPVADEDMEQGFTMPELPPRPNPVTAQNPGQLNRAEPLPFDPQANLNRSGLGQGMGGGTMPTGENVLRDPMGGHKMWVTLIVVISLGVVGAAGAWVYFTYINPTPTTLVPPPTNSGVATTTPVQPVDTVVDNTETENQDTSTTSTDNRILFGEPLLDTDSDGLDDEYEKKNGTDMLLWDTDSDTLSDGDEILTWKTDPLKNDTDGDTFPDGVEIRNGYNPRGEGKLFAAPTSTTAEPKP